MLDASDPRTRQLISAFADGELNEAEMNSVRLLLRKDQEARDLLAAYERTRTLTHLALTPPDEVLIELLDRSAVESEELEFHHESPECRQVLENAWKLMRTQPPAAASPVQATENNDPPKKHTDKAIAATGATPTIVAVGSTEPKSAGTVEERVAKLVSVKDPAGTDETLDLDADDTPTPKPSSPPKPMAKPFAPNALNTVAALTPNPPKVENAPPAFTPNPPKIENAPPAFSPSPPKIDDAPPAFGPSAPKPTGVASGPSPMPFVPQPAPSPFAASSEASKDSGSKSHEGHGDDRSGTGERWYDVFSGWMLSLIIHVTLFTIFARTGWLMGGADDRDSVGQATEVSIVLADDTKTIGSGPSDAIRVNSGGRQVKSVELQPKIQVEPITLQSAKHVNPSADGDPVELELMMSTGPETSAVSAEDAWSDFAAAGGGEDGGGGGASFFGLEAKGGKFVFVVDRSGSMSNDRLRAAKQELVRSISAMKRGFEFYVIFYSDDPLPMPGNQLVTVSEQSKRRVFSWFNRIHPAGGTNPSDAMRMALNLNPDAVWLLTDGEFGTEVLQVISRPRVMKRTQIHTIAFYSNKGEVLLKQIARENNGQYRYVAPPGN